MSNNKFNIFQLHFILLKNAFLSKLFLQLLKPATIIFLRCLTTAEKTDREH